LNLLEDRPHPPVIALSGLASSADHLATQAAGFTGHVDKPVNDGLLVAAVRVAIALRSTSTGTPGLTKSSIKTPLVDVEVVAAPVVQKGVRVAPRGQLNR